MDLDTEVGRYPKTVKILTVKGLINKILLQISQFYTQRNLKKQNTIIQKKNSYIDLHPKAIPPT